MDTKTAAEQLGTSPRVLRRFLRSGASPFSAVGSGGRYEFGAEEVALMSVPFQAWQSAGTSSTPAPVAAAVLLDNTEDADRRVWDEEGEVALPDIRDPRVRARVRAVASAQEARLNELLLAAGLHISQMGLRVA